MLRVPDCGRHTSQARGCSEWGRDCHVVMARLWQRLPDPNTVVNKEERQSQVTTMLKFQTSDVTWEADAGDNYCQV
jgi:hypothetical protein